MVDIEEEIRSLQLDSAGIFEMILNLFINLLLQFRHVVMMAAVWLIFNF